MTGVVLDVPFDPIVVAQKRQSMRSNYRIGVAMFAGLFVLVLLMAVAVFWETSSGLDTAGVIVVAAVTAIPLGFSIAAILVCLRGDGRPADWVGPQAAPPVAVRVTTNGLWLAGGDPAGTTYTWDELRSLTLRTSGSTWLQVMPGPNFTLGISEPSDPLHRIGRFCGAAGITILPETLAVPMRQLDQAIREASNGRHGIQS